MTAAFDLQAAIAKVRADLGPDAAPDLCGELLWVRHQKDIVADPAARKQLLRAGCEEIANQAFDLGLLHDGMRADEQVKAMLELLSHPYRASVDKQDQAEFLRLLLERGLVDGPRP